MRPSGSIDAVARAVSGIGIPLCARPARRSVSGTG